MMDKRSLKEKGYATLRKVSEVKGNPAMRGKETMTLRTLSEVFDIKLNVLRQWAAQRMFPLYKPTKRKILVKPEEFRQWLEQFRIESVNVESLEDRRRI